MNINQSLESADLTTVKGGKYYAADEVESHLKHLADTQAGVRQQAAALQAENQELLLANQRQSATIRAFRERNAALEEQLTQQLRDISLLGEQLTGARHSNTEQKAQMDKQALQVKVLHMQVGQLQAQVAALETQTANEAVEQARKKADRLLSRAIADSDRVVSQAMEQRTKLIATCRAAYYSALQFKQDLAEQFRNMEQELDASIDVLQMMDSTNTQMNLNHTNVPYETNTIEDTEI